MRRLGQRLRSESALPPIGRWLLTVDGGSLAVSVFPEPSGVLRRYSQVEAAVLVVAVVWPKRAGLVMQVVVYSSFVGVLLWFGVKVKGAM